MKPQNDILQELNDIGSQLGAIPRENVFVVPDGYFEWLPAEIQSNISVLNFGAKPVSQDVPIGYFEGLADVVLAKIKTEASETFGETAQISPVVAAIGKGNVFQVPENYFETNIENINRALPKEAKVVQMAPRKSVWKYAAAAVVTGLLAIAMYFLVFNKPVKNDSLAVTTNTKEVMAEASQIIKTNSFDAVLNSISDEEIEKYLESRGADVNAALVAASATEDKDLPSPEDYLFDETTLQQYLNKNNLEN